MKVLRLNAQTFPITTPESDAFAGAGITVLSTEQIDSDIAQAALPIIDGLLVVSAKVTRASIDRMGNCRIIVRYGSGTDNVDVERASERGILVANVPDFCLSEVADHTMALLLACARKLRLMDRYAREGRWRARTEVEVHRIAGKVLGLVGFGSIAQQVARRACSFDLAVIAFDPFIDPKRAQERAVTLVPFGELLEKSDFVSLHVPLSSETHHMIGEAEIAAMKRDAILVNTGRGGLVDEGALVKALQQHRIAAAGIDVFESLPMFDLNPAYTHHPFFDLDNVILTPHTAGISVESMQQLMLDGAREAIAVLNGSPPQHSVNRSTTPVGTPMRKQA
jgi:D-3-phosphoglycerate dehydrogenase